MKNFKKFLCAIGLHSWLQTFTYKGALFHPTANKVYEQNFVCTKCEKSKSKIITKK